MIVICEPRFRGFEHTQVNAALIGTAANAFQEEELLFLAAPEHIRNVKNILDAHSVVVRYHETTIPIETFTTYQHFRFYSSAFHLAHKNHANTIIFCSITTPGLISIKALLRRYKDLICQVVLHDELQDVTMASPLRPDRLFFSLRFWISFGNTHRLRYVVLGQRIQEALTQYVPRASSYVSSIDLPYFFNDAVGPEPFADNVIRFGSYGIGSFDKGTDIFFKFSEEVQSVKTTYKPRFTLIGYVWDKRLKAISHKSVSTPSLDVPLNVEAYEKYGRNNDYALFFNRPNAYELRASGAILDAFFFLKPIIAMNSPLSEYYFKKMGDIGYLCQNYNAMRDTVLDILETVPTDRYRLQQENILIQRVQFSPAGVSTKFRSLAR